MTCRTLALFKRETGVIALFGLLILVFMGCASQQEIRAKKSLERASATYAQAKANPNVETYAPKQLADAGRAIQTAQQSKDFTEMEQLSYLAEKKSQTALAIAEGKVLEKEVEGLSKEETDVLMRKRLLEAQLAKTQAEVRAREAEQAKLGAARDAAVAEKQSKEAQAKAREAEEAKREAQAKAREAEQAKREAARDAATAERERREAEAKAREAEQARLVSSAEAERAEKARREAEARAREAEQAKAEVDQLLKDLADLQGKMTERGIVLTLGDVLFAFGKADLSSGAVRNLEKLTEYLKRHPDRYLLIEGHTDSIGSDEFNRVLSQRRADAVKEVLVGKGTSSERIVTKGYGKQFPIAGNDTESGRQLNRRVEVVILNEGVKPETATR